jgi:GT2 family glycosyltransferase
MAAGPLPDCGRAGWGERVTEGPVLPIPVLSVLTVGGDPVVLRRTYRSLAAQTDRRWQWCVALPGSQEPIPGLPLDPRVVVTAADGTAADGTAADGTAGLATALGAATGVHVMVLAPGDLLARDTVEVVEEFLSPQGWGYTDEEQRFPSGRTPDVWEKPEYSPELLRSQPYAVRTAVLPRAALAAAGGIRAEAGSAAWYDAVLRVSEHAAPGVHVPSPQVIRMDPRLRERFVEGDAADSVRVVAEHCARVGIAVEAVEPVIVQGRPVGQRLRRPLLRRPTVSIVVPTAGGSSVVRGRSRRHVIELARSLWVEGRYPDLELVVVHDAETPPDVLSELRDIVGEDLVLCAYDDWFHFSRKCNLGAAVARGEYLCFLNDDMEIGDPAWLTEMVVHLQDPGVGGVGARLLFPDGTLQHIGHRYETGDAGHPLFGWRANTLAMGAAAHVAGERAGVTAACLLLRASDFQRVGGFSELFPLNYNDVDLCLKLREEGFRIVYTPHAELVHFESQSRVPRILRSELTLLDRRWSGRMKKDPYLRDSRPVRPRSTFVAAAAPAAGVPGAAAVPVPAARDRS